jgi:hypothetical protein
MKPAHLKKALLLPTVLLTLSLISCVDPSYSGGYNSNSSGPSYASTGFNTYTTLPTNYSGNAYLVGGRYYSGGQYQTGNYSYQGRSYPNRYRYNGQYYYGGNHRAYGSTVALQNNGYIQQTNGFNTYTTLPTNYSGNAYLLGGRYYSGGQYQTGNYSYQGRSYPNRYNYNGQYYYGGSHRAYGSTVGLQRNGYNQQSRY